MKVSVHQEESSGGRAKVPDIQSHSCTGLAADSAATAHFQILDCVPHESELFFEPAVSHSLRF